MPLQCTLVRGPGAGHREPPVELTIEASIGTHGGELQTELEAGYGTGLVTVDGIRLSDLTVGKAPLVDGAVIVDDGTAGPGLRPRRVVDTPAPVALAVHSGAGAGIVFNLTRGVYSVGRSNADISIPDPDLSREHARVVVSEAAITIEDLGSANGTEVDGKRVRCAAIAAGSTIRCGNSTMSVIFTDPAGVALKEAGASVQEPLVITRPSSPGNRAALLLTAVLPLVMGVGLAAITGMWMFLAFTAVSAVSVVVPVLAGRRQRRELAAAMAQAVRQDQERRRRSAPPLSDLVVAESHGSARRHADLPGGQPVWLRLGEAEQSANIRLEPPGHGGEVPSAGTMPVTLGPHPVTGVSGRQDSQNGLVRSVIMQLASYPRACSTSVVVHGPVQRLPLSARFLPRVTLSSDAGTLQTLLAEAPRTPEAPRVLLVMGTEDPGIFALASANQWQVIHFLPGSDAVLPADIMLGHRLAELRHTNLTTSFVPDLVPEDVFSRFCRRFARQPVAQHDVAGSVPGSCLLTDLVLPSRTQTAGRWAENRLRSGLGVPVGRTAECERTLDLQADGPHLLVAGTTGSGKSEFLRSLIGALALSYPPDRINFLFVDFKGGSGLAPLTGLPHCVGVITDLNSHQLERSLASLRAEIRLREELLASVQAPDLAAYRGARARDADPLPHLVVVIDEFRMLVEQAPAALTELMRIAAIGRSLGIHLVMATQRPQGALTADIRANVTTSIALRVQSEMESMDIINSKAAAGIGLGTPGRAFLARGTEAPVEFQAASLSAASSNVRQMGVRIHDTREWLNGPARYQAPSAAEAPRTPAQAAAPLVEMMSELWTSQGGTGVRRPVAAPLPSVLPRPPQAPAIAAEATLLKESPRSVPWALELGLMDLPDHQRTVPLSWRPALQGHVGLVGAPQSGMPEALAAVVGEVLSHPVEAHVYILDAGNTMAGMESSPRVGAMAGLHEPRRAARILERLVEELARRLAGVPSERRMPLVLAIAGWDSWASSFRSGPWAWAEELVHDLVRDGGRAGIVVLIAGQRELVTSRLFAALPNRFFFPAGSSEESRLAWPRLPATPAIPGRAVASGAVSSDSAAECQFYATAGEPTLNPPSAAGTEPRLSKPPFRVEPLPRKVAVGEILIRAAANRGTPAGRPGMAAVPTVGCKTGPLPLLIGLGGDELAPVSLSVPAGGVLAVLGGYSAGKTTFLQALPELNPMVAEWLAPQDGADSGQYWKGILRRAAEGTIGPQSVALVDDADLAPPSVMQDIGELNSRGISVVFTAGFSPLLVQRVPLALKARGAASGLLIRPRNVMDGDLFGVRFDVESSPPAGRSVLITGGTPIPVQLGWPPEKRYGGQSAGGDPPVLEA